MGYGRPRKARLLRRRVYSIQWLSRILRPLGTSFSALTALTIPCARLPQDPCFFVLRASSCISHICDSPLALLLLSSPLMVENLRAPYLNISSIEHALPFLYHPDPGLNACMLIFILVVNNLLENSIWESTKPL